MTQPQRAASPQKARPRTPWPCVEGCWLRLPNGDSRSSRPPSASWPPSATSSWVERVPPEEACPRSACCVKKWAWLHCRCIKHVVLIVFGQLTNLILFCNTFYVTFLFPLETLHMLTRGMISSGVDWTAHGWGEVRRKWAARDLEASGFGYCFILKSQQMLVS